MKLTSLVTSTLGIITITVRAIASAAGARVARQRHRCLATPRRHDDEQVSARDCGTQAPSIKSADTGASYCYVRLNTEPNDVISRTCSTARNPISRHYILTKMNQIWQSMARSDARNTSHTCTGDRGVFRGLLPLPPEGEKLYKNVMWEKYAKF